MGWMANKTTPIAIGVSLGRGVVRSYSGAMSTASAVGSVFRFDTEEFCVSDIPLYRAGDKDVGRCISWEQQHLLSFCGVTEFAKWREKQSERGTLDKIEELWD